jgi:hypothetical protein
MKMNHKRKSISDQKDIKEQVKARADKEKQEFDGKEKGTSDNEKSESPYFVMGGYLCRQKYSREGGEITIPLCNFTGRIVEENIIDDGQDSQHLFSIEGKLFDKIPLQKLEIPAEKFASLSWTSKWGSKAILEPGATITQFVRHAIQKASTDTPVRTHYGHTGWREINGQWVYLHAGGAIGAGPDITVSVKLNKELSRYTLSPYPFNKQEGAADFETEKKALEASLSFLDLGSRAVTLPLFCLVYLSPLTTLLNPQPNFSGYIFGQSGTFKTSVALVALSHFGMFSGAESLSNFDDTPGILEKRSFTLKDILHVIDDFHPSSNRKAQESKEGVAQRMIRAYANRTARGRLNSDMSERGRYEPRGIMIMTAEEQPGLESTLARVCIIEVAEGAIDRTALSAIQMELDKLPLAMASYIYWIKKNMTDIKESFPARFRELRALAASEGFHKKLPEAAAFMGFALETATSFFYEKGILSKDGADALVSKGWGIFKQLAEKQQQRIKNDDPVDLYFNILSTLLTLSQARLDKYPNSPDMTIGGGEQLGWYNNEENGYILLIPESSEKLVRRYCRDSDIHFPFSKNTFLSMLKNKKIIQAKDDGKTGIKVSINGSKKYVWKVVDKEILKKCGVLKLTEAEENALQRDLESLEEKNI